MKPFPIEKYVPKGIWPIVLEILKKQEENVVAILMKQTTRACGADGETHPT